MSLLPGRLALALLCALPAFSWNVGTANRPLLATFMYACDNSTPEPKLTTTYAAAGKPSPKGASDYVAVYRKGGDAPEQAFDRIGQVQVLASTSRMTVSELEDWARRGARQLGGDALTELAWDDAASVTPKAGPVGLLVVRADVVRWR